MSDYSVFKVQVAKKGIKCFRSLLGRTLSFQVVADEKAILSIISERFFEKFSEPFDSLENS